MRLFRSAAMGLALAVVVFASGSLVPVAAAPCAGPTFSGGKETVTFCFTGAAQTWTVPAGVTSATFSVSGAQGGGGAGNAIAAGLGGRAVATLVVAPGATITIVVGGQGVRPPAPDGCPTGAGGAGGFNGGAIGGSGGGGNCGGSGGGGASDVRIGGSLLANRVVVAGGGGGASPDAAGGSGGAATGGNGGNAGVALLGGNGGTQAAGGAGGTSSGTNGANGTAGVGGGGGPDSCGRGGGGGGGGFFGGGGGGAEECGAGGGAGGGSGRGPAGVAFISGFRAGAGLVTVTFARPLPAASASQPPIPWLPIGGLAIGLTIILFGLRRRRATA
jgi:Glycine rich protein